MPRHLRLAFARGRRRRWYGAYGAGGGGMVPVGCHVTSDSRLREGGGGGGGGGSDEG